MANAWLLITFSRATFIELEKFSLGFLEFSLIRLRKRLFLSVRKMRRPATNDVPHDHKTCRLQSYWSMKWVRNTFLWMNQTGRHNCPPDRPPTSPQPCSVHSPIEAQRWELSDIVEQMASLSMHSSQQPDSLSFPLYLKIVSNPSHWDIWPLGFCAQPLPVAVAQIQS